MIISEPFREHALHAIPGTSMAHGLHAQFGADVCHSQLTPACTLPVFYVPDDVELTEAVAVVFRDYSGKPVHGGLYALDRGDVVKLRLVDQDKGVDTGCEPAWTAFGMVISVGALLVKGCGLTQELPWSIIDFGLGDMSMEHALGPEMSPARQRVYEAYAEAVVPQIAQAAAKLTH
jgi:hypothetical protein